MSERANEPAFPVDSNSDDGDTGLTIREHFAGLAMQGILAYGKTPLGLQDTASITRVAVDYADALIAALERK